MNIRRFISPLLLLPGLALLFGMASVAVADEFSPPPQHWGHHHERQAKVSVGRDATLRASEHADAVVAILGSANSAGEVADAVVAILGDTHVTGPVGQNVVAVLGDSYVDSTVTGNVVAVLGDVTLGPQAQISGNVTAVGGDINRDPAAIVSGNQQSLNLGPQVHLFAGLRQWMRQCLLYGRLLAFEPGLGWAWTLAGIALVLYALTALAARAAVERCVHTLESLPLQSLLAALLTVLATPALLVLLCISLIGILAVPFIAVALLSAEFFGKLVLFAWIGRRAIRILSPDSQARPELAVLLGGALALVLYTVPVLGLIAFKLIGFVGLGVVVYTVLLAVRSHRAAVAPAVATAVATAVPSAIAPAVYMAPAEEPAPSDLAAGAASAGAAATAPAAAKAPSASAAPSAAAALAFARAGFWPRMGALLLDVILVGFILSFGWHSGGAHLLLLAAYGAVMWKLKGATIGGIVFNLQVVRADGRELDWSTAIVRALSCFLSLFVLGLGFIWIAIDHEHQAWHDKIAGTVVVSVPKGVSLV
jgi:uncharacterized RDD family membrane protein YckC